MNRIFPSSDLSSDVLPYHIWRCIFHFAHWFRRLPGLSPATVKHLNSRKCCSCILWNNNFQCSIFNPLNHSELHLFAPLQNRILHKLLIYCTAFQHCAVRLHSNPSILLTNRNMLHSDPIFCLFVVQLTNIVAMGCKIIKECDGRLYTNARL